MPQSDSHLFKLTSVLFNAALGQAYYQQFSPFAESAGMDALARGWGASDIAKSLLGDTYEEQARTLLSNLGLDPDSTDSQSGDYIAHQFLLANLAADMNVGVLALLAVRYLEQDNILPSLTAVQQRLDNRATVAEEYSKNLGLGGARIAELRSVIQNVTSEESSVAQVVTELRAEQEQSESEVDETLDEEGLTDPESTEEELEQTEGEIITDEPEVTEDETEDTTEEETVEEVPEFNEISGTLDSETIYGTSGKDRIASGAGSDRVFAYAGDDYILAGDGDDNIRAGVGNDRIYGEAGDDNLDGEDGDDYIEGGDGNDRIDSGAGSDEVYGGNGDDYIVSYESNMTSSYSSELNDISVVFGEAGNDQLYGLGRAQLYGGDGDDTLVIYRTGDSSSVATIVAGEGADTIWAESGTTDTRSMINIDLTESVARQDTVSFELDTTISSAVVITGFDLGLDKLDFTEYMNLFGYGTGRASDSMLRLRADGGTENYTQIVDSVETEWLLRSDSSNKTADEYGKAFFVIQGATAESSSTTDVATLLDDYGNNASYTSGYDHIFMVNVNETDMGIYLFHSQTTNNTISSSELTPLAILTGITTEDVQADSDFIFGH